VAKLITVEDIILKVNAYSSYATILTATGTQMPRDHTLLPATGRGDIPASTLKLVLDSATLEGCKAELT